MQISKQTQINYWISFKKLINVCVWCTCLTVCAHVFPCVVYIFPCMFMSFRVCIFLPMCVYVFLCVCTCLSMCGVDVFPCVYTSFRGCIFLSTCVHMSFHVCQRKNLSAGPCLSPLRQEPPV